MHNPWVPTFFTKMSYMVEFILGSEAADGDSTGTSTTLCTFRHLICIEGAREHHKDTRSRESEETFGSAGQGQLQNICMDSVVAIWVSRAIRELTVMTIVLNGHV